MRLPVNPLSLKTFLAWFALFAINILGILPWARVLFQNVDLAEMVYEVERLRHGFVVYKDTFTHHFIGYVIPFYLIDHVVPLTPTVLKSLAVCVNFVNAILVFVVLREIAHARTAWVGASLTVTVGWFWGWQGFGFNIQSYVNPLLLTVFLFVSRSCARSSQGFYFLAALSFGVLLTFDQRAAVFATLLALPPAYIPALRNARVVLIGCFTASVIPLFCVWGIWWRGAWADFVQQTLVFPLLHRNHGINADQPFVLTWLIFVVTTHPSEVVLAAAGAIATCTVEKRGWLRALLATMLVCAAVYSASGGRAYPNYLLVLAPSALISMSMLYWYASTRSLKGEIGISIVLLALGVFNAARPLLLAARAGTPFLSASEDTVRSAARFVVDNTELEDGVLVWGFAPQIHVLSGRYNTFKDAGLLSIAGGNFASTSSEEQSLLPGMTQQFWRYLNDTPPRVIIYYVVLQPSGGPLDACYGKGVPQHNLDFRRVEHLRPLKELLERDYDPALLVSGHCDRAEIYVHKGHSKNVP